MTCALTCTSKLNLRALIPIVERCVSEQPSRSCETFADDASTLLGIARGVAKGNRNSHRRRVVSKVDASSPNGWRRGVETRIGAAGGQQGWGVIAKGAAKGSRNSHRRRRWSLDFGRTRHKKDSRTSIQVATD